MFEASVAVGFRGELSSFSVSISIGGVEHFIGGAMMMDLSC